MSNYSTEKLAIMFKALGNPNRLKIFSLLSSCCAPGTQCTTEEITCCVSDLDARLDIAASTLSHHLKEMKHAGLIEMHRQGKQIFCSINTDSLQILRDAFPDQQDTTL